MSFAMSRVAPEKAVFRPALALRSSPGSSGTNMTKMSYAEQRLHPLWQRKRLELDRRARELCAAAGYDYDAMEAMLP